MSTEVQRRRRKSEFLETTPAKYRAAAGRSKEFNPGFGRAMTTVQTATKRTRNQQAAAGRKAQIVKDARRERIARLAAKKRGGR